MGGWAITQKQIPGGMTERKATARTSANTGVSPLRCALVEMTGGRGAHPTSPKLDGGAGGAGLGEGWAVRDKMIGRYDA